ncbi:MAG TPA: hypothetical protein VGF79_11025, partial [Bacteroidia bacterium]
FSSKTYSLMISGLYKVLPQIEVYTIVFFVINFFSWLFVTKIILEKLGKVNLSILLILLSIGLFYQIPSYIDLQFTVVSCLASLSAIVCFSFTSGKSRYFYFILFLLGIAIRPDTFGFVLLLFFILSFANLKFNASGIKKLSFDLGIVLIIGISFIKLDQFSLTEKEESFKNFNTYKGSVFDYELYKSNEYYKRTMPLYSNWFLSDPCINSSHIDYGSKEFKFGFDEIFSQSRIKYRLSQTKDYFLKIISNEKISLPVLFTLFLGLTLFKRKSIKFLITFTLLCLFIIVINIMFKPVPYRLILPMFAFLFVFSYLSTESQPFLGISKILLSGIFIVYALIFAKSNVNRLFWTYNPCNEILNLNSKDLYVVGPYYDFENVNPFKVPDFRDKNLILSGTYSYFNTLDYSNLQKSGQSIYLLETVNAKFINIWQKHLLEYHQIQTEISVKPLNQTYEIQELRFKNQ